MMMMIWKLLFLFYFTHDVLNVNGYLDKENHPHRKLIDVTFDTRPNDVTATGWDVGEPLILTQFIENKKLKEARQAARVNSTLFVPGVESYAGYLTVNKKYNGNLWFWYFPVANKSIEETPLIIWLQGGPGSTSLFGLFVEIGPFVAIDNQTVELNAYSWGQNHSLLFIDNPVGAGYSFTDDDGYATNQTTIGENLYCALQQFLTIFPELRTAPLFIAGESYAGKHIPSLGIQILRHKQRDQPINLQGLAIGNGFVDPITLQRYSYFAREVGLLDDETADILKSLERNVTRSIKNGDMEEAFDMMGLLLGVFQSASYLRNPYNYLSDNMELLGSYTEFVQTPEIRRALHVGNTAFSPPREVYNHLILDFMNSAKHWLEKLLKHYRILLFNGHLDCMVPYHASVNTYGSLKFPGSEEYQQAQRYPWLHNGKLAGYVKTGGLLSEVMVRGAGHMVPLDKPAPALALITAFVRGLPLNHTSNFIH